MSEPWNLTEPQRRQLREAQAAAKAATTPCPECGCLPSDAWGCDCSNEDCPCGEPEDDDG